MTTIIAMAEGILADEKLCGNSFSGPMAADKVMRLSDGSLLAGAGTFNQFAMLVSALEATLEGKEVNFTIETNDIQAARVMKDGSMLFYDHATTPYYVNDKVLFLGSGACVARTAVFCGRDYPEAMRVAGQLDEGTSPAFSWYPLETDDE